MRSPLLIFSLSLNLLLLGVAGYRISSSDASSGTLPPAPTVAPSNRPAQPDSETAPPPTFQAASPMPLRWSEIESADDAVYVANLRRAGCPETVVRRIISDRLRERAAREAFNLVQPFHRDFWDIAARENARDYFAKTFGSQVKALHDRTVVTMKRLLGEAAQEPSIAAANNGLERQLTDFLPRTTQEQMQRLTARYEARLQAVAQANLSAEEKARQLAQLRQEMENEQAQLLSPEEWTEFQLRRSSAAKDLQELHGVDFAEGELRAIAQAIHDHEREANAMSQGGTEAESLDQKLEALLGPARFADFNRARSATYRELYDAAIDGGRPAETAAELFDLRLRWEQESEQIRGDGTRPPEQKQALLDELQEQAEQAVTIRLGPGAYQSYKAENGGWIKALGRL